MKISYDNEVDALYVRLGEQMPDGVVETAEGVNVDTTVDHRIVGIEILNASKRMDLRVVRTLEFDAEMVGSKVDA
jgi:uncharacterized protein YuzE